MTSLLFGLLALALTVIALRAFARANPAVLAGRLRLGAGVLTLAAAALCLTRGLVGLAVPLGAFGWWLVSKALARSGPATPGQTSRVETRNLEMELDHETGAMRGHVREGRHKGRDLDGLTLDEKASLWTEWQVTDPQSARLLESYLDRTAPGWHDSSESNEPPPRHDAGPMSIGEACAILGVTADASPEDIRSAHRALLMKVHPDHGGSTYLAAKINEAKDLLLAPRV